MVTGSDVRRLTVPLTGEASLDPLLRRIGQARVVQLGEVSHGTHEYYRWRAALTRRLVEECGFSFVAVEGDWPGCERVDAAVRCAAGAPQDPREALDAFERWPTWMWANAEVVELCRWLRGFNAGLDKHHRVGFHGLDVYSLWESMRAILVYLREHRPGDEEAALAAYRCFEPYAEDPQEYALALRFMPEGCQTEVVRLLARLRERAVRDGAAEFAAWQHAEVVAGAERYYRAMLAGGGRSWNEDLLHREAPERARFVVPAYDRPRWQVDELGHQAIGVVYHPWRERHGNYMPTRLAGRYDAFYWFDETSALHPLHLEQPATDELETYPTGV